jgi:pimeloyl-ACP methyl ester carboxylesterase
MTWGRLGLALVLVSCGAATAPAPSVPAPKSAILDGLFEVSKDTSLHIHCEGNGSPTVIMDAGLGMSGVAWGAVAPEVYALTRACVYDRAGIGYSDPPPRPHTSGQMAKELHALISAAKVPGPYVLVGHSFAGLNVRLYAAEHPDDVVGMVLVDVATEDQLERIWALYPPDQRRINQDAMRAGLRENPEGVDFDAFLESVAEVRRGGRAFGDRPLVALSHGKPYPKEPGESDEIAVQVERVIFEMHASLSRLSTNGIHVVDPGSGHFMQADNPKLVVGAIREVVLAARSHGRVDRDRVASLATKAGAPNP